MEISSPTDERLKHPGQAVSHVVTGVRFLTESTFVLRFTRGGMKFRAGQHLIIGLSGEMDQREYSIYSGENDDYLEILVKEIKEGIISSKLKHCEPGQLLNVNGPFGSFGIESTEAEKRKHIFIATGTGISPFHSIIRSDPGIDYMLVHGVQFSSEAYDAGEYDGSRYFLCTSREEYKGWKGRVTAKLSAMAIRNNMVFYLCGNGRMIHEAGQILRKKGIPDERILTEIYF